MVGQFKDDRLQNHQHGIPNNNLGDGQVGGPYTNGVTNLHNSIYTYDLVGVSGIRTGSTTRGKRKGVKYIIKVL